MGIFGGQCSDTSVPQNGTRRGELRPWYCRCCTAYGRPRWPPLFGAVAGLPRWNMPCCWSASLSWSARQSRFLAMRFRAPRRPRGRSSFRPKLLCAATAPGLAAGWAWAELALPAAIRCRSASRPLGLTFRTRGWWYTSSACTESLTSRTGFLGHAGALCGAPEVRVGAISGRGVGVRAIPTGAHAELRAASIGRVAPRVLPPPVAATRHRRSSAGRPMRRRVAPSRR